MTIRPTQQILRTGQRLLQATQALQRPPRQDWLPVAFQAITADPLTQLSRQLAALSLVGAAKLEAESVTGEAGGMGDSTLALPESGRFAIAPLHPPTEYPVGDSDNEGESVMARNWETRATLSANPLLAIAPSENQPIKPLTFPGSPAFPGEIAPKVLSAGTATGERGIQRKPPTFIAAPEIPTAEQMSTKATEAAYYSELSKIFRALSALNITPSALTPGLKVEARPTPSPILPSRRKPNSAGVSHPGWEHPDFVTFIPQPLPAREKGSNSSFSPWMGEAFRVRVARQTSKSGMLSPVDPSQAVPTQGMRMVQPSQLATVLRANVVTETPFADTVPGLPELSTTQSLVNPSLPDDSVSEAKEEASSVPILPEMVEEILEQLSDRLEFDFIRTYGTSGW